MYIYIYMHTHAQKPNDDPGFLNQVLLFLKGQTLIARFFGHIAL